MGGPNTHGDPAAWLAELASTVDSLKARVSRGGNGQTRQGNTGTRNSVYPTPATDEARVALANARITWFNTDTGWSERYYAPAGPADLDPQCALIAGTPAGWYPVGEGPYMVSESSGVFNANSGNYIGNWLGTSSRRRGGADWFTQGGDGLLTVKRPGVYDLGVATVLQEGAGTANFHLRILDAAGSVQRYTDGLAYTLNSSFATHLETQMTAVPVAAGWRLGLFCHSGALNVHAYGAPGGQMFARYKGPMLLTE